MAALATGAAGITWAPRFIATSEAPVHHNVKQALVKATELDTVLVMRALRNTERAEQQGRRTPDRNRASERHKPED